jgi:hypothetical protein
MISFDLPPSAPESQRHSIPDLNPVFVGDVHITINALSLALSLKRVYRVKN